MGFYSPSSVVYEAKRKGIRILGVDVTRSLWDCTIEMGGIRLGFRYVKQLGGIAKEAIEREIAHRPFLSIEDFVTRTKLNQGALERLATVGAFECFGLERRQALWAIMSLAKKPHDELPIEIQDNGGQLLNPMATYEELIADFQGMDLSTGMHPMKLVRPLLAKRGVLASNNLTQARNGSTVAVAGVVIIRQRPMTAKGFMFLTLEDETGLVNVVVKPALTEKFRRKIVSSSLLLVRGTIEHKQGVTNVIGREFLPLQFKTSEINLKSRDFR
jgi:error-prone DNA polymerase